MIKTGGTKKNDKRAVMLREKRKRCREDIRFKKHRIITRGLQDRRVGENSSQQQKEKVLIERLIRKKTRRTSG